MLSKIVSEQFTYRAFKSRLFETQRETQDLAFSPEKNIAEFV